MPARPAPHWRPYPTEPAQPDGPVIAQRTERGTRYSRSNHKPLVPAGLAAACLVSLLGRLLAPERPNIFWFTCEDMSSTLGYYGDTYRTTPNPHRLARESVRFTLAFVSAHPLAHATLPAATPSRSARSGFDRCCPHPTRCAGSPPCYGPPAPVARTTPRPTTTHRTSRRSSAPPGTNAAAGPTCGTVGRASRSSPCSTT